jgi:hypothetical protein
MLYDFLRFHVADHPPTELSGPAIFVRPAEFDLLLIACNAEVVKRYGSEHVVRRPRLDMPFEKLPVIRYVRHRPAQR